LGGKKYRNKQEPWVQGGWEKADRGGGGGTGHKIRGRGEKVELKTGISTREFL